MANGIETLMQMFDSPYSANAGMPPRQQEDSIESRLEMLRQLMTSQPEPVERPSSKPSTGELLSLIASAIGDAFAARQAARSRTYWEPRYVPSSLGIMYGKREREYQERAAKSQSEAERKRELAKLQYEDLIYGTRKKEEREFQLSREEIARREREAIATRAREDTQAEIRRLKEEQRAIDERVRKEKAAEAKSKEQGEDKVLRRNLQTELAGLGIDVSPDVPLESMLSAKGMAVSTKEAKARQFKIKTAVSKAKAMIDDDKRRALRIDAVGYRFPNESQSVPVEDLREEMINSLMADLADADPDEAEKAIAEVNAYFDKRIVQPWANFPKER